MEALYLIPVLTGVIGIALAFLSGVYYGISLGDFRVSEGQASDAFKTLEDESGTVLDSNSPFFIGEWFMYFATAAVATYLMVSFGEMIYEPFYVLPVLFVLLLILRTVFYALGSNFRGERAERFVGILHFLLKVIHPAEKVIYVINRKVSKYDENDDSLQELSALVDTVCETADEEEGDSIGEYTLLKNVIKFGDVLASDIMTPRTVLFSRSADSTVGEALNTPEIQMYSRFPIYDGESLDDGVVGYVMSKDIFRAALEGKKNHHLREFTRELHFVPENSGLETVLDLLLKQKQIIFLVVDEYGGIEGLISMEDVIETMLGAEIVDEADKVADLREVAKQRRDKRIAEIISQNSEE